MLNSRRLLSAIIGILFVFLLSGCFPDLGDFESDDAYTASFGSIYLYSENSSKEIESETFSMSDFYYEDMGDELRCPSSMDSKCYSYMAVEVTESMKIEELYLYVIGGGDNPSGTLSVDIAKASSAPSKSNLRKYDDEDKTEFDNPIGDYKIGARTNVSIKWSSFGHRFHNARSADSDTNKTLDLNSGEYIIFRFKNNTAYGKDVGLEKISFQTTALMVRVV